MDALRDEAKVRAVCAEAVSWLRTPWMHNQAVKHAGVDCARLMQAVCVNAGVVPAFDIPPYPSDWMLHRDEERFLAVVTDHCFRVVQPLPGDMAIWRYFRCFSHGAIVIEWPRIIHAYLPERMVCWGDGDQRPLRDRPVQFWRPRGLLA